MESTKIVKITEYLSEWEVMLQNHPGRISLNCSISIANKDLIVKCTVTPRSGLIAFDKTPTVYLFSIKDYENVSVQDYQWKISKSFSDFMPVWISLAHEIQGS